jgi:hypothetical protein
MTACGVGTVSSGLGFAAPSLECPRIPHLDPIALLYLRRELQWQRECIRISYLGVLVVARLADTPEQHVVSFNLQCHRGLAFPEPDMRRPSTIPQIRYGPAVSPQPREMISKGDCSGLFSGGRGMAQGGGCAESEETHA